MDKYALIKEECLTSSEKDPIKLIFGIMKKDYINIHGPEHHILDGSCFLTAMHNAGVEFNLSEALDEMAERGAKMPGATCGQWGMCGSAASVGAALSIINGSTPLSSDELYKNNLRLVSKALGKIAEVGGPRCCKRNAFLSLQTAVRFVKERYDVELPESEIKCVFSKENKQCMGKKCPFFGDSADE